VAPLTSNRPEEMRILLLIGTGSFIGGVLRYSLSQFIQTKSLSSFPFGTLGVNIIGCFAIGLVFALSEKTNMSPEMRLFLATGICGGFTTFSAFSNETFSLMRDGQLFYASAYITSSVLFGVFATFIGYSLLKLI
jgi:CrcB protein